MTAVAVSLAGATTVAPDPAPPLSIQRAERIAGVFKALSDPVRVRLLHHISANCCSSVCVCHIPDDLGITQPTLSYHLSRLLKAGLISKQMRGKWAHYTATTEGLAIMRDYLSDLAPAELGESRCACPAPNGC